MQKITPFLWFDRNAEEAAAFYVALFRDARILSVSRYGKEAAAASGMPEGTAMTVAFRIEGQDFTALNGGPHFRFSEALSFVVHCDSQAELDYYWRRLADGGDPAAQRCGWLKDRYGLSWQIVPRALPELLQDARKAGRVMKKLLQMTKIDIAALQRA
ncbi:MAG: VOC family protein [Burkholderiales bacterium]|nr:VOC family protein [Burkholderiales bacterium]